MFNTELFLKKVFDDYYNSDVLECQLRDDTSKELIERIRADKTPTDLKKVRASIKQAAKFLDENGYVFPLAI